MHALRHEEFATECLASCNGPFDGKWSKTMIGYGPEDSNFVLELTYTYSVKSYDVGNDLHFIKIKSRSAYNTLVENIQGNQVDMRAIEVASPGEGYRFLVVGEDAPSDVGPLTSICLNVTDIELSLAFWVDILGFLEIDRGEGLVVLSCSASSATLRLRQLTHGEQLRRGNGFGRLALAVPAEELGVLQDRVKESGDSSGSGNNSGARGQVVTELVELETPGKASVTVVILADPDGHEVCLVGEEGFSRLSKVDENAPKLLGEAIAKDTSNDWFEKRAGKATAGKSKATAVVT